MIKIIEYKQHYNTYKIIGVLANDIEKDLRVCTLKYFTVWNNFNMVPIEGEEKRGIEIEYIKHEAFKYINKVSEQSNITYVLENY